MHMFLSNKLCTNKYAESLLDLHLAGNNPYFLNAGKIHTVNNHRT